MSWSDEQLCDHLEGLLPAADAARLASELESDAALAARLAALRAVLAPPVLLPDLPVPADVAGALRGLLEARGEVDVDDPLAGPVVLPAVPVPPDLTAWVRDAARAAAAAEAAPEGRLLTLAWVTATRLAALVLLALGLGLAAGVGLASPAPVATGDAALLGDLARARDELAQARHEQAALSERLSTTRRERDAALLASVDLQGVRGELAAARREASDRTAELAALATARDGLRGELERARAELAGGAGLRDALAASRAALAEARAELSARTQSLEAALAARPAPPPDVVAIRAAEGVERWDDRTRGWTAVQAGERLALGAFVRGTGPRSRLDAGRPLPVGRGLFVVGQAGLAPVPASVDPPPPPVALVAERPTGATPWASVLPAPPGLGGGRD